MWQRHWQLSRDPFAEDAGPFVPSPVHAEAVARLAYAIEAGERRARLVAGEGLGKSRVLRQALAEAKGPTRRIACLGAPPTSEALWSALADRLGASAGGLRVHVSKADAWRRLADAVRLCHWQGLAVVLAVDDCHLLAEEPEAARDLERLAALGQAAPGARLTVVQVGRGEPASPAGWELAVRLVPLSRTEAEHYLSAKLAAAGRADAMIFTPRAVAGLHALAGGVPRGLDRLASLALAAGAMRGLEAITPEVVEAVARECEAFCP